MTDDTHDDFDFEELNLSVRERRERMIAVRAERVAKETLNQDRDRPIREAFHDYVYKAGLGRRLTEIPPPGGSYKSSHLDMLWHCFKHATLAERSAQAKKHAS